MKKPGTVAFLCCLLMLMIVTPIGAEEEKETEKKAEILEDISVTATRTERSIEEVPVSVVVVDKEDIEDLKMFNIKEALAGEAGILAETRNQGYDARLIIRGAGLKARYGVREIMVLLDGVPMTDPDSFTRLDFVDTQLIERIEVVKGPASSLWGANAAGGVINITTKSPMERQGGVAQVGVGNYDTRNYHASYSGQLFEKAFITVSGSRRESDNDWRRWNEFSTNQFTVKPTIVMSDTAVWENHFSYTEADTQLPGKLDEDMFRDYRETGDADETEGPWQFSGRYSEVFFGSSKFTKEFESWDIRPLIYLSHWKHHHPVTGRINNADTLVYGTDIQANQTHSFGPVRGTLTAGVTARFDDQTTDYYEYAELETNPTGRIIRVLSDKQGNFLEEQDRKTALYGVYLQESIRPTDRWIIDLGARYDRVDFDISGFREGDYDWGSGQYVYIGDPRLSNPGNYSIEKTFDSVSPSLGLTYKILEGLNAFGNVRTGVQTPTEGELSENPDLDLAKVQSYEIGLKARTQNLSLQTSVYYSPVKDEIVQVVQPEGTTDYVNAGKTDKIGYELAASYEFLDMFRVGLSYAYSDYTFDEFSEPVREGRTQVNEDRSGNRLPYIPEHQYSFFLFFKHPLGFKGSVRTRSWGDYYMDNANTEKYGGYDFLTSLMVGYERESFDVALIVDNVFDKRYAVEAQKDTSGEKTYTPGAPISFIVRVTYKF